MLLHVVHGPTSFSDLKTVDGVLYPSFQLACKTRGLLEDDKQWVQTLQEAAVSESPQKLRELFVVMLVFCQVSDPAKLWDEFKLHFSEDILHRLGKYFPENNQVSVEACNQCLILIEDALLRLGGHNLQQFNLPQPTRTEKIVENPEYMRELDYNTAELTSFVEKNEKRLTKDQQAVYESVIDSIASDRSKVFFLDAPGGTGKTFIINLVLAKIRSLRSIAIAIASSGIAATLLEGGRTAHSALKLPLNLLQTDTPTCNISKQSNMAKVMRDCKLIVWDESTMAHKRAFEALDRTLKDIRANNDIMGGVTVLLAGDFRQTLPIIPRGTRADEVQACVKSSPLWPYVNKMSLSTNMRVFLGDNASANQFSSSLLSLGDGNFPESDGKVLLEENLGSVVTSLPDLMTKIYPDVENIRDKPMEWLRERAILSPRNDKVFEINELILKSFDNIEMEYKSIDSVLENDHAVHFPIEFLNTLEPPGLPSHSLHLKIGAPIILLRNLNPPKLCNGTRLQITALHKKIIEATVFTGCATGESVFIPRIPLIPSGYQIPFKRLQFPVKLSFAMTINKSQGQTLKIAGIDLREDCFSHGQLYVACSRVSSPESLVFLAPDNKTSNVVYKEVLK
ncbi:ATP-dependent DNA helicase pif1-like [Nilaparvata lugens]|uniref:ATP-dependent DNA helicase pif1-like n=1 Tax=Nilaparvata lugens TaxID=108931 RepID=UPI00193E8B32|nr:ATP-dependent DNA helicase pif1-like [Nilaparvata lugens]XP_039297390.1 ATP-dependent DNA helicase pif1-like [Nilaparvata lugens]